MPQRSRTLVNAFNLVPVVERVLSDRQKIEVECISVGDRSLYVGTGCGLIVYYQLEENKTPLGKTVYQCKVKGRIQLGGDRKKAVQQVTVVPNHKKLLALVDGLLYVMHMYTLEIFDTGQRISRLQCYCVDESKSRHSSGAFESTIFGGYLLAVCPGIGPNIIAILVIVAPQRKKLLQMYAISGEKLVHLRDFSISEPAMLMSRDGNSVCVAMSGGGQHGEGRYIVINVQDGGKTIDLLGYDAGTAPIVKRTGKGEFLVNAGTFGVIAFASGVSNRPPVEWRDTPPKAATYIFPYVITWSDKTGQIHVYNLLDQRCVQEIPFPNGRFLGEFSGKLYAALDRSIYLLASVPLKEQVIALLDKQLVEEAVLLAETIAAVEGSKDSASAEEYMCEVKQRAAFIYFSLGTFSQAETLFFESNCDPREVIALFSGLLPAGSSFSPHSSSLHGIPSVEVLATSSQLSVKEAKKFLIRYLKEVRTTSLALGRREDIDTSLVKLLAEDRSPSLIPYITNHELYLAFDETKQALEQHSCYHALGMLYYYSNQASEALSIWTRICDGELKDKDFPGFEYIIDFLSKYSNAEVVLRYAKWALERDEREAVKIFTTRNSQENLSEKLNPNVVLDFLSPFRTATIAYLEHIINDNGLEEERYHTKLAILYLEEVQRMMEEGAIFHEMQKARDRLELFLENSTHYRVPELLSKVQDTDLYMECAILYGRMEEHEKALSLLTHKLKDYRGAENYCVTYSKDRSRQYRQTLFQTLLAVYLSPKDKSEDTLIRPALSLLNAHGADFDAAQVLALLPPNWPISTVKAFLMHSLRSSIDTSRTVKIEHSLARGENLQARTKFIQNQGGPVVITGNTRCPVCNLPFNDAAFVRYPNGIVTHLKCGRNKTICPVTGTWFGE